MKFIKIIKRIIKTIKVEVLKINLKTHIYKKTDKCHHFEMDQKIA